MVLRGRRRRGPVDVSANHGDFDLSLLRKPIAMGVEGALQVARCLQSGTPEVRALLLHECELIYECKVCRSMFRSLTNLVGHKRVYCTESYCESKMNFVESRCENETVVVQPAAAHHKSRKDDCKENVDGKGEEEVEEVVEEKEERIEINENEEEKDTHGKPEESPPKRSLRSASNESRDTTGADALESLQEGGEGPSVLQQMLQGQFRGKSEEFKFYTKAVERANVKDEHREVETLTLKVVEGNPHAVYQITTSGSPTDDADTSEAQNDRKRRRKQVHQVRDFDEGEEVENPSKKLRMDTGEAMVLVDPQKCDDYLPSNLRHSSQLIKQLKRRKDCDLRTLTCLKCSLRFSIMKNLYRHMCTVHSQEKRIFPCLYCKCEYGLFWNLCRHITVKHKKNKNQIDRIKELLKSKSYVKKSDHRQTLNSISNLREEQHIVRKKSTNSNNPNVKSEVKPIAEKVKVKTEVAADKPDDGSAAKPVVCTKPKGSSSSQSGGFSPARMTSSKVSETVLRIRTTAPVGRSSEEPSALPAAPRTRSAAPSVVSDSDSETAGDSASVKSCGSHGNQEASPNQGTSSSAVKNGKSLPLRVQQALKIDWDSMKCPKCQKTFWKKKSLRKHSCSGKPKATSSSPFAKRKELPKPSETLIEEEDMKIESASHHARRSVSVERSVEGRSVSVERIVEPQHQEASSQSEDGPRCSSSSEREELQLQTSPVDSSPIRRDIAQQRLQDTEQLQGMLDEVNLKCLKCGQKYTSLSNLHQHCIRHLGWKRYKCRLCVYTSYNYSEIAVHLRRVHMPQVRGSIIHRYIHDLETDKLNILSYRFHSRPPTDTSHLSPAEKIANRIKPEVDVSNIRKVPTEAFNISTRNSPRTFDTSPYRAVDQMSVLSTRRGLYVKPQMKTRRGSSSEDDSKEDEDSRHEEDEDDQTREVEYKEEDSKSETSSVASMPTSSGSLDSRSHHMPTLSPKPSAPVVKMVGGRSFAEKTKLLLQSSQGTDSVLPSLDRTVSMEVETIDSKDTESVSTCSDIIETATEMVAVSGPVQDIDVVVVLVSEPSESVVSDDNASQVSQTEETTVQMAKRPKRRSDMTVMETTHTEPQPGTDVDETTERECNTGQQSTGDATDIQQKLEAQIAVMESCDSLILESGEPLIVESESCQEVLLISDCEAEQDHDINIVSNLEDVEIETTGIECSEADIESVTEEIITDVVMKTSNS